jgi:hypothetical protein
LEAVCINFRTRPKKNATGPTLDPPVVHDHNLIILDETITWRGLIQHSGLVKLLHSVGRGDGSDSGSLIHQHLLKIGVADFVLPGLLGAV